MTRVQKTWPFFYHLKWVEEYSYFLRNYYMGIQAHTIRAEAREAAANAATDEPPKSKETAKVAVQAEEPAQATRDAAVQVDLPVVLAAPHSAAVKAALQPQAAHQPKAAQAARRELPVVQAAFLA